MSCVTYRQCTVLDVAVTDSATTTGVIQYENFNLGMMCIESTASPTTLTWYASHDGTTYQPAYSSSGALEQTVDKDRAYPIPEELAGARWIKAVGNAACTLHVVLKA